MHLPQLTRRSAIIWAAALGIAVGVWLTLTARGAFDAAVLAGTAYALLILAVQQVPKSPKLAVDLTEYGEAVSPLVISGPPLQPIDIEALVASGVEEARSTEPPEPAPPGPGSLLMFHERRMTGPLSSEPTRRDREKFTEAVEAYASDLREWLTDADARRHDASRDVYASIALSNNGDREATHVRIRLRFPEGWTEIPEPDDSEPPAAPNWDEVTGIAGLFVGSSRERTIARIPRPERTPEMGLRGPSYSRERDRLVAEYRCPHLSAGLPEPSGVPVKLRAPAAGSWEVHYEVFADSTRPRRGTLRVEVKPVEYEGEVLTRLSQLVDADADDLAA